MSRVQLEEIHKRFKNLEENMLTREEISTKLNKVNSLIEDSDTIKPSYYKAGEFDVIAFCQYHDLPFDIGNIIKYATRAGKKEGNAELQDLNKAKEYLERRIKFIKGE